MSDRLDPMAAPEEVLEPELPICDPHQHLWRYPGNVFLGRDLIEAIGGHNVLQTVAVEAWPRNVRDHGGLDEPWQETARAVRESLANPGRTEIAAGIVGYADLRQGDAVVPLIAAHIEAAESRLSGIRATADSPLTDATFIEGCEAVARQELALDLVTRDAELPNVARLAARFPHMPIIIDHLGLRPVWPPDSRRTAARHDFAAWAEVIEDLAGYENLYMKLGGIGMDPISTGWGGYGPLDSIALAELMRPWYFHCIEQFGAQRCMLESNFPVDARSFSYNVHWNAAKRLTEGFTPEERTWLFQGTATKAYRL